LADLPNIEKLADALAEDLQNIQDKRSVRDKAILILSEMSKDMMVRLVAEVVANLIKLNPVLTGWSRANWIPSLGQPYEGEGDIGGMFQSSALAQVIAGYSGEGEVYIANNVDYILDLLRGSSRQAPANFDDIAIQQALSTLGLTV